MNPPTPIAQIRCGTNQVKMTFDDLQSRSRTIENLLLNRVGSLQWMYYDVDLNQAINIDGQTGKITLLPDAEVGRMFKDIEVNLYGKDHYTGPGSPTDSHKVFQLLATILKRNPRLIKNAMKRIFDVNDIENHSSAGEGILGEFNDKDRLFRNKKFKAKIRSGFRQHKGNVVILAEGDS
jgi:hypothetical protein